MKKLYSLLVAGFFSVTSFAQIATWQLSSLTGVTGGIVSTSNVAPGVASAFLQRGSGVTAVSANGALGSSGWTTTSFLSTNDYYQITITLSPTSQPISSFGTLMVYVTASEPGPDYAVLRSSQNGYTTNVDGPFFMDASSGEFSDYLIFDISSLAPVFPGGTISLRLYGYEANNGNSNATFNIGDGVPGGNADIIFGATLPVTLSSFAAENAGDKVAVKWTTAKEINSDYFAVERSADGYVFEEIGRKEAAGNNNTPLPYSFTDNTPLQGKSYYRLRQVDIDEKMVYSPAVTVTRKSNVITLSPSPAADLLQIRLDETPAEDGLWQVFDMAGRLVQSGTWAAETTADTIEVSTFESGIYVFRLMAGQEMLVKKFRKI